MMDLYLWQNIKSLDAICYGLAFALAMSIDEAIKVICANAVSSYRLNSEQISVLRQELLSTTPLQFGTDEYDGAIGYVCKIINKDA